MQDLEQTDWIDCQPGFDEAHFVDGFGHADGRFHFCTGWSQFGPSGFGPVGDYALPPALPDHWTSIEAATDEMPFRLVTAPARHYLNSRFNETPTSTRREGRPTVMLHPDDAVSLGVQAEQMVTLGNNRGELSLSVELFDGLQPGVVIVESIWPNDAFAGGQGINVLTGAIRLHRPAAPRSTTIGSGSNPPKLKYELRRSRAGYVDGHRFNARKALPGPKIRHFASERHAIKCVIILAAKLAGDGGFVTHTESVCNFSTVNYTNEITGHERRHPDPTFYIEADTVRCYFAKLGEYTSIVEIAIAIAIVGR